MQPVTMTKHIPMPNRRTGSDAVWPLRNSKGQTFAEAKAEADAKKKDTEQ